MGTPEALDAVTLFKNTVDDLQAVESGVISAKDYVANTTKDSLRILDDAKSETLSRFIQDLTGKAPVIKAPNEVRTELASIF